MRIGSTTLRNYAALCQSEDSGSRDPAQLRAYVRMHRAVDEDPVTALRAIIEVSRRVADDEVNELVHSAGRLFPAHLRAADLCPTSWSAPLSPELRERGPCAL